MILNDISLLPFTPTVGHALDSLDAGGRSEALRRH